MSNNRLIYNLAIRDIHFYTNYLIEYPALKKQNLQITAARADEFFHYLCKEAANCKNDSLSFSLWLKKQTDLFLERR